MPIEDKVIIEVAVNENQVRASNPHIPYTPAEIAKDAKQCLDAGAAVIHFHARDPVTAAMSSDIELNLACQRAITEDTPLMAYPTYGDIVPVVDGYYEVCSPASVRFRHFVAGVKSGLRFEVGPIDLGAFYDFNALSVSGLPAGPDGIEGWMLNRGHQINNGYDHVWLARFCDEYGLHKSFAAPDTMSVLNLRNMIDMGLVPEDVVNLKLFFFGGTALTTRFRGMHALSQELFTDKTLRWMPVVQGCEGFALAEMGLAAGGDVRIGLGDYHYGDTAPTNAELVDRLVALARRYGREPATPDEARQIKGSPALKQSASF
ncbi:3-keto-5-aminohexanoate cleavage protein [Jatrophihabitans sp. DSM 45814]